ncbi:hypothetical protein OG875_17655 [Streptomyces sp. NBC_01498]|uniref:hypothetical protein n=1 Tax=Streptomyces sp. NBC_01498 TaxID=2975870 RepID=UPI002E7C16A4|nr:hypothetical protein [Streptomyces sp. NBC_01498]WTL29063.1 hypothetical protein OG875_17655 [Streptomyces sp. NBC_01498]
MTGGARPVREPSPARTATAAGPAEEVRVGDTVHDPVRDRVGVVMDHLGPNFQLRPLGGGREWDADPARVRPPTPAELLSARVADVNTRSVRRTSLGEVPGSTWGPDRHQDEDPAFPGGAPVTSAPSPPSAHGNSNANANSEGDGLPGQPWSPTDQSHQDSSTPPGDGEHRK